MNINEAEKLTGVAKKTIRYYEEAGLLSVRREERTGYRIFKEEDINRLKVIKLFRNIGVPIQEIRAIMDRTSSPSEVLLRQLQELNSRIQELQMKKDLLNSVMMSGKLIDRSEELIFDMEDVLFCDTVTIKDTLDNMEKETIILASMGASPQVNELLQKLLPDISLKEEQQKLGRVRIEEIEEAQAAFIIHINNCI